MLAHSAILQASLLDTPLGSMVAVADESKLHFLEFVEHEDFETEIEHRRQTTTITIIPGRTHPIAMIERELDQYFNRKLKHFSTPLFLYGTPFQQRVWEELQKIPFGQTRSYADIAQAIGKPSAFRAVAQANGANNLAIIIPCHRVINTSGQMGGYSGGLTRKKWLLDHEKSGI